MKKITLMLTGLGLVIFSANAQHNFTVNGKFTALKQDKKVFLNYRLSGKQVEDSTVTKNGAFSFKGKVSAEPIKASISLKPITNDPSISVLERMLRRDEQDFFLEKGITQVMGTTRANKAVITGGKTQSEYQLLCVAIKPEEDKLAPIREELIPVLVKSQGKGMDTVKRVKELGGLMQPLNALISAKEDAFFKARPDSYVSLNLLQEKSSIIDPKTFEPLLNSLSARLKQTDAAKVMANKLDVTKKTAIGVTAKDFSQPDVNGKMVSLSAFKGKYVLLDFWASWCGPCRAENPHVLKAYNRLKDKNFDILAVSLDNKKENWLKAVKDDAMPWTQVSDLLGWKNQAAGFYAVTAIPQNFLIDPNGVIVAKNLRGDKLEQVLAKFLEKTK
jgi:peroxiredoxin